MEIATQNRIFVAALIFYFASLSCAVSQDYTKEMKAMFDATSFDFGTVARGAKVEHRFTIENIYEEDIQILAINSSCGCTTPRIDKRLLKTWEKAELVASVDTRNHMGQKDVTIEVTFGGKFPATVQIPIHVYIRSDIVVQPDEVQFGTVRQGKAVQRDVTVSYAGRENWQIQGVECSSPYLEAVVNETSREQGAAAQISYNISVTLKPDAPAGYLQNQIVLITNDPNPRSARVPISVEGKVESALTVSSQLLMNASTSGQPVSRSIVIKGNIPFRIVSTQCDDDRFECSPSKDAKSVHVIPVTFTPSEAKANSNPVHAKIHIETDMPGASPMDVSVTVQMSASKPRQP